MTSTEATRLTSSTIKRIHFIGIGGIGISAIARMFLAEGKIVSGSDRGRSLVTDELAALGARIFIGQAAVNVPDEVELVVYTIAIPADNPELVEARRRSVPVLSYPEMLGRLSVDKYTIAVSGTHGKTTTTGMLATILLAAEFDPTVVVGSFLLDRHSNFIAGRSDFLVVEACEYRRSFLNLSPRLAVITNIEEDHLDYYRDLADIQDAFAALAAKIPPDGFLICNPSDPVLAPVLRAARARIVDYAAENLEDVNLPVPGEHNRRNAQAALAAARALGIEAALAKQALNNFHGTWRRLEFKGNLPSGAQLYDDYAHHPSEIAATLQALREKCPGGIITVIFQPHLYSRTKEHFAEFVRVLALADHVILLPIYAAREPIDPQISSEQLVSDVNRLAPGRAWSGSDFAAVKRVLAEPQFADTSIVITMGAGDVSELPQALLQSAHD